jgi:HAMP domain-containing protein
MPRPQFTLKTLLWLMVAVAVACAAIPPAMAWYRQQQIARERALLQVLHEMRDRPVPQPQAYNDWVADEIRDTEQRISDLEKR